MSSIERNHCNILDLFKEAKHRKHGFLRVSAPMVRYSKLEFRHLLRKHFVELCFTPMIIADSFINSDKARQNEFCTSSDDNPVIAQFAAKNAMEFLNASQLIYPYVDGVDLNCGCPQSWAISKGYGCGLLKRPEKIKDIILNIRRVLREDFSVSVKMRLLYNEGRDTTVDFARQLEKCGVSFITLHGRNMWQKSSEPLNVTAIQDVKQSLQIPLVANGGVRTWEDACNLHEQTNADGIMSARGLLANPALFNPYYKNQCTTPLTCVQDWLNIGAQTDSNLHFMCFHHHLTFMWSSNMKKKPRLEFNSFTRKQQIYDFFKEKYHIEPSVLNTKDQLKYQKCTYNHFTPEIALKDLKAEEVIWNSNSNDILRIHARFCIVLEFWTGSSSSTISYNSTFQLRSFSSLSFHIIVIIIFGNFKPTPPYVVEY
uniref:DUS-like FMN-binding domain-containing protein n=1 Tax=Glossina brevipalpis TaxID=37001 RepID=A0A1A9WKD7_9MUSC